MFLFISLFACGEPTEDGVSTQITPSSRSQTIVNLREPTRPDGATPLSVSERTKGELSHLLIELEELEEAPLLRALELLNTTTGPCEPCMTQGISTADCLLGGDQDYCVNIPDYAAYVVSVAINNEQVDMARAEVTFVEPWQPISPYAPPSPGAVQVNVGLDLVDPFTPGVLEVVAQLESTFGDQLEISYRYTPLERNSLSQEATRLALSGVSMERVISAYGGGATATSQSPSALFMQEDGVEARYNSPEVEEQINQSIEMMSANSVVTSPTFWVDGYRCSGAHRVEVLSSMVERIMAIRAAQ